MSVVDLLHPHARLVVGVEVDPNEPGLWRVYLGQRGAGVYVLTADPGPAREWENSTGHIVTVVPPDTPVYETRLRRQEGT